MLNSGKRFRALCDKKKYSNSRVVRKKIILNETKKTITPPLQVKWSVPYYFAFSGYMVNVMHDWHIEVISPDLSNVTEYY